jgi:hypothetical protein
MEFDGKMTHASALVHEGRHESTVICHKEATFLALDQQRFSVHDQFRVCWTFKADTMQKEDSPSRPLAILSAAASKITLLLQYYIFDTHQ